MLPRRTFPRLFLVAAAGISQALVGPATVSLAAEPPSLNELELEVDALYLLYQFQITPEQLRQLQKLARETADDLGARQAAKAGDEYRKVLTDLRAALVKADDADAITKLQDRLDELAEKDPPELDTAFDVTDEARKRAPEVLRRLSARQVASYVSVYGDAFPDPVERLREALESVRGLEEKDWKELRDHLSDEVGRLVAGLDADKAARVGDKVVQWLIEVRSLGDGEFKAQRGELLEKAKKQIVGDLPPLDVMRNALEFTLAELLSNPRLGAALEARLKAATNK